MPEQDTPQLIKETARKLFQEKGFSATKTRDIAQTAGINLALVNYYFRSKKQLYDVIMLETIEHFMAGMLQILNDTSTSIHEKLENFVSSYINLLRQNPEIPLFMLNEFSQHPQEISAKVPFFKEIKQSVFLQQFEAEVAKGNFKAINSLHFMLNVASLTIFPFIAKPIVQNVLQVPAPDFDELMQERKKYIPLWIKNMLWVK
ncbi:MAG: TetR/AcrR family transcriptional regulator [Chitinophagales bacterium]|nr:TetR/AcrR family transcriptional regulator [Bacteroidota bacterium]MCB9044095.1 TetR/AcrR family transcriptional regulator [Chitinophagales bacterium]